MAAYNSSNDPSSATINYTTSSDAGISAVCLYRSDTQSFSDAVLVEKKFDGPYSQGSFSAEVSAGRNYFWVTTKNSQRRESGPVYAGAVVYVPDLPIWSRALSRMLNGVEHARLFCIGDSTTAGVGADPDIVNDKYYSWPHQLSRLTDYPARATTLIGGSYLDERITYGAGWNYNASDMNDSMAGAYAWYSEGDGSVDFALDEEADTLEFLYFRIPTGGTDAAFSLSLNEEPAFATMPTYSSVESFGIDILFVPNGNYTLHVEKSGGTKAYFGGVVAYSSASKDIIVMNAGWSGAKTTEWNYAAHPWSAFNTLGRFGAHLFTINLGINDNTAGLTETQYKTQYQAIIDKCHAAGGDVVLIIPNNVGGGYAATFGNIKQWVADLAALNNLPLVDLPAALGTYDAANAAGYMYDQLHPTGSGYTVISNTIEEKILP